MLVNRLATIYLAIIILNPIIYDAYAQTRNNERLVIPFNACLLYTSDAADE